MWYVRFAFPALSWMGPLFAGLLIVNPRTAWGQPPAQAPSPPSRSTARGDAMLARYFAEETQRLQQACLAEIQSLADWEARRPVYRQQLREMLGLEPWPAAGELAPVVTGRLEHAEFLVEKLYFQSLPGLYVTANYYRPRKVERPLPAILYVCGHSRNVVDGVPLGAKVGYQHHGEWYARNGYVCLTIDTLQLGEIEGIHHGTYRYGMWWWLNRGYTPAGVEAFNGIRAIDYLLTRPEVDPQRIGVTGRSGGGAYSWFIAALDDRVAAVVPTAGITDLKNHVVDGTVEGHCDCMFFVNTYRWDYPLLAALVAPRPLLISNTDSDRIFPLDGVYRIFEQVRRIYRLYDAKTPGTSDRVGLNISPGPHQDTQELNTHEFRWFQKYLKEEVQPIDTRAPKWFDPRELKVYDQIPADALNTRIHETFVPAAPPPSVPSSHGQWQQNRQTWMNALRQKVFRGWPEATDPLDVQLVLQRQRGGRRLLAYDYTSQGPVRLRLYVVLPAEGVPRRLVAHVAADETQWQRLLTLEAGPFWEDLAEEGVALGGAPPAAASPAATSEPAAVVLIAPRGVGRTTFDPAERKQVQIRRRFYLLGQTLEGMQIWDVRRAVAATRHIDALTDLPLTLVGEQLGAALALYAALFEPAVHTLQLVDPPISHDQGPYLLNVSRVLDLPHTVALAAEQTQVVLQTRQPAAWDYPQAVAQALRWQSLRVVPLPPGRPAGEQADGGERFRSMP